MLNNTQLDIAAQIIALLHGNVFAFYVVGHTNGAHDIYYTLPHTTNTGSIWNPVIQALQHMGWSYTFREQSVPVVYSVGTVCAGATEGMRRFLNATVRQWNVGQYYNPGMGPVYPITLLNNLPANTNFHFVAPDSIVRRSQLDPFIPAGLGAAPGFVINFDQRSKHLHRLYMALAFRRARYKFMGGNEGGHLIAAVLVDRTNGSVRTIAHNTKNVNTTFHAEVNVVQAFLKNSGAERNGYFILYTTLQPCPMCAAMIAEYMPNTMVFYGQTDPGLHMNDMVLEPNFCHSMTPQWNEDHLLKPLRVWGTGKEVYRDDYKSQNSFNGGHMYADMHTHMGQLHDTVKGKFSYGEYGQRVYTGSSLTRNLRKKAFKENINGAALTLDRKVLQYPKGGKNVDYSNQHSVDILRVIQHIRPLIDAL